MHSSRVPVTVAPHTSEWAARFAVERAALLDALGPLARDVQHFGSTSVPGLWAKPTVDILLGTLAWPWPGDAALSGVGYVFYKSPTSHWRVYLKPHGDDPRGVHLHVVEHESDHWRRHLLLRDYLRAHADEAARYGAFKREMAGRLEGDRGAYQRAKAALVEELERRAVAWRSNGENLLGG